MQTETAQWFRQPNGEAREWRQTGMVKDLTLFQVPKQVFPETTF